MSIFRQPHQPVWAKRLLLNQLQILEGIEKIMALVQVDQAALDSLSSDLTAAITAVGTEITNLEAQVTAGTLPAASLDGLNSALTALQALEVPAPTPPAPSS
jgi:hypothetical protein